MLEFTLARPPDNISMIASSAVKGFTGASASGYAKQLNYWHWLRLPPLQHWKATHQDVQRIRLRLELPAY